MAKYLICGSYTEKGLKGLLMERGTKRLAATPLAVKSLGGTLNHIIMIMGIMISIL